VARLTKADDRLITTFGRLVEAHSSLGRQLGRELEQQCGISHTTFEVLLRISRADGGQLSMSSLAQQVALTTGGITRLLDRMIEAGLVQRVPCPTDRRVAFAALTASGQKVLNDALQVHAANLRRVFDAFSSDDLSKLDELLDRLRIVELDRA
jgi:MarR family transcriptional regulator, 2-MHQ and catechol-resistance regulon repressor